MTTFVRGILYSTIAVLLLSENPAMAAKSGAYKGRSTLQLFQRPCFPAHGINNAIVAGKVQLVAWSWNKGPVKIYMDAANKKLLVLIPIRRNLLCALASIDNFVIDEEAHIKLQDFIVYEPNE